MARSKISTNSLSKYLKKNCTISSCITFIFMTIRSWRILCGRRIFRGCWNLPPSLVVPASWGSSGPCMSPEKTMSLSFWKYLKSIEYRTKVKKSHKLKRIFNIPQANNWLPVKKRATPLASHRTPHRPKTSHPQKKMNLTSTSNSSWTCRCKTTTSTSSPRPIGTSPMPF